MAKNKGKNNNYQTETRRAADLIAKHEEVQRSRHKMLPHRLTTTEKKTSETENHTDYLHYPGGTPGYDQRCDCYCFYPVF